MFEQGPGQQLTPEQKAQIQANVAAIRAKPGTTEADVQRYLAYEMGQAGVTPDAAEPTSAGSTGAWDNYGAISPYRARQMAAGNTMKDFGRAVVQHGMLNFGDEAGIIDPNAQGQFEANHPALDMAANVVGGAVAPAILTYFVPALASLGGAALVGGATGLAAGAGQQDPNDKSPGQMVSRANNAAAQGAGGMVGGAAGHQLGSMLGKGVSAFLDKINPSRVMAKGAAPLVDSGVQGTMDEVNKLAPGGASIANSTNPSYGLDRTSRFKTAMGGQATSPVAGAMSEQDFTGQARALQSALDRIGQQIQAREKVVPLTPQLRAALSSARELIGKYAPDAGQAATGAGDNPLGLELSVPFSFGNDAKAVTTTELHDALSRMRYTLGRMQQGGIDAPGQMVHDYTQAIDKVQKVMYSAAPDLAGVDQDYAKVAERLRVTEPLLEAVQRARASGGAAAMSGNQPGGGFHPASPTKHGMLTALARAAFGPSPEKLAMATQKYITAPGGADAVARLMAALPASHPATSALTTGVTASAGGSMVRHMFSPIIKQGNDQGEEY